MGPDGIRGSANLFSETPQQQQLSSSQVSRRQSRRNSLTTFVLVLGPSF